MAADIEIKVRLKTINGVEHAVPDLPGPGVMMKGKTVRYSNDDKLPVTIVFVTADGNLNGPSPFGEPRVSDQETHTLIHAGQFLCGCRLMKGTQTIGWMPGDKDSPSGGVHDVGPH